MVSEADSERVSGIELAIVRILLVVGALMGVVTLIGNLLGRMPVHAVLFPAGSSIVLLTLLLLSYRQSSRSVASVLAIVFFDFVYVPVGWLSTGGSSGALPFVAFLFMIATMIVLRSSRLRLPFLVGFTLVLAGLLVFEFFYPEIVLPFPSDRDRLLEVIPHFLFTLITAGFLLHAITQRYHGAARRNYRMSITDELTGVYNRRHLRRRLQEEVSRARREDLGFTLVCLEIENFRALRERHGATLADLALVALGRILLEHSRQYDVIGRYGGDEFFCLLPNTESDVADAFTERITKAFAEYARGFPDVEMALIAGVSPGNTDDADALIAEARDDLQHKAQRLP
jgi:diguanylate cyclase (GGDEF)-like protein